MGNEDILFLVKTAETSNDHAQNYTSSHHSYSWSGAWFLLSF